MTTVIVTSSGPLPTTVSPTVSGPDCSYALEQYGYVSGGACRQFNLYYLSYPGNITFAVLFGLCAILHIQQASYYKKGYCWAIIVGAISEFIAFAVRSASARRVRSRSLIQGADILFLLAPLFVNAFAYMTFSRLVRSVIPISDVWHDRNRWISKWYFWMLLTASLTQTAANGIMFTSDASTYSAAQKVYIAGIAIQGFFDLELLLVAGRAFSRMASLDHFERSLARAKALLGTIIAVIALILVRIIFRIVDFGLGEEASNPLATNELPAFFLDALPMVVSLILFIICHPGRVLVNEPDQEKRHSGHVVDTAGQQQMQRNSAPQTHPHFVNEAPPNYELPPTSSVNHLEEVSSEYHSESDIKQEADSQNGRHNANDEVGTKYLVSRL